MIKINNHNIYKLENKLTNFNLDKINNSLLFKTMLDYKDKYNSLKGDVEFLEFLDKIIHPISFYVCINIDGDLFLTQSIENNNDLEICQIYLTNCSTVNKLTYDKTMWFKTYLNSEISDEQFHIDFNKMIKDTISNHIFQIKYDLIKHNYFNLSFLSEYHCFINLLGDFELIDIVNDIGKDDNIFIDNNDFMGAPILKDNIVDVLNLIVKKIKFKSIFLKFPDLYFDYINISGPTLIGNVLKTDIKNIIIDNDKILRFNNIKDNLLKHLEANLNIPICYKYILYIYILYGLENKLFSKQEIYLLEKNQLFLEIMNNDYIKINIQELLTKNNFKLTQKLNYKNSSFLKKEIDYPIELINPIYEITKQKFINHKILVLFEVINNLIVYKSSTILVKDPYFFYDFTENQFKDKFLNYSNIFAKYFKYPEKELINLIKTSLKIDNLII